jgi:hypothetical protein
MKLIDLFKLQKKRKSQNVPNEKEGKFSRIKRNPYQADADISDAGNVLDNSRGDDTFPHGK